MLGVFNDAAQWGLKVAQGLIDPNNIASALVGIGIAAPIAVPVGWYLIKRAVNQQKQASRKRDLTDDNCPLIRTDYREVDGGFEQRIRGFGDGIVSLRDIFKTNTDLHVGYIHQAAELANKSDDPIIFNHLYKVIPSADYENVMYDITADLRLYFGPRVEGHQDKFGDFVHPILVKEKSAHRKQIRIFLTSERQTDIANLPAPNELLLEISKRKFVKTEHANNAHLETRRHIAQALTTNQKLNNQTFVAVEP